MNNYDDIFKEPPFTKNEVAQILNSNTDEQLIKCYSAQDLSDMYKVMVSNTKSTASRSKEWLLSSIRINVNVYTEGSSTE